VIEFEELIAVLGKIEDHGKVAALSAKTRATAAREDRSPVHATKTHGRYRIFNVARNNYSNRNLPVVRSISGVERAITITEAHFPSDNLLQILL
jgi:hypothetical protein